MKNMTNQQIQFSNNNIDLKKIIVYCIAEN